MASLSVLALVLPNESDTDSLGHNLGLLSRFAHLSLPRFWTALRASRHSLFQVTRATPKLVPGISSREPEHGLEKRPNRSEVNEHHIQMAMTQVC
jgi:hypothetical protein